MNRHLTDFYPWSYVIVLLNWLDTSLGQRFNVANRIEWCCEVTVLTFFSKLNAKMDFHRIRKYIVRRADSYFLWMSIVSVVLPKHLTHILLFIFYVILTFEMAPTAKNILKCSLGKNQVLASLYVHMIYMHSLHLWHYSLMVGELRVQRTHSGF